MARPCSLLGSNGMPNCDLLSSMCCSSVRGATAPTSNGNAVAKTAATDALTNLRKSRLFISEKVPNVQIGSSLDRFAHAAHLPRGIDHFLTMSLIFGRNDFNRIDYQGAIRLVLLRNTIDTHDLIAGRSAPS